MVIMRTCHWCHVMERESFEDGEAAAMLNAVCVCVKVDREERPDVDHLYMEACVALTGSGGWPLTCFLDHDRRPFFAGTYFLKTALMSLLDNIGHLWKTDRKKIASASESVTEFLRSSRGPAGKGRGRDAPEAAYRHLEQAFDPRYGGFGSAPKFPSAHNLLFLLRYGLMNDGSRAFDLVLGTLDGMAAGGMFDHVGGGFCRYSTDSRWLVPHFEKMLYDNAMLSLVYAETSAALGRPDYGAVARRVYGYCMREMLGAHGGFFTAQDADSEGVEGKSYLWKPAEVRDVLGQPDGDRFCRLFDITPQGNFEGGSIPNLIGKTLSADDRAFADGCFGRLLAHRDRRVQPFKDDKALASSNALMIASLASSGRLLREPAYIAQGEGTARFVLDNLVRGGRLMSSWREGTVSAPATSDDYAYLVWGLFELYQATFNPQWLRLAVIWADNMLSLFWDAEDGGLFLSGSDVTDLLLRQKNMHDGALPSGNSVAALNLLRLARATGNEDYENKSTAILEAFSAVTEAYPSGSTALLCASLYHRNLGTEVVIANGTGLDEMLGAAAGYLPFTVISVRGQGYGAMDGLAPFARAMEPVNGLATAYLCSKGACQQPVTDPNALREKLKSVF